MLTAIEEKSGRRVPAWKASTAGGTVYLCPLCKKPVSLKRGNTKKPHFSHHKDEQCDRYYDTNTASSEWNTEWLERFPESSREVVLKIKDERHIASAFYNDYIISFQQNFVSPGEFIERTKFFTRCYGCKKVIWLFDLGKFTKDRSLREYAENKWNWTEPQKTFDYFHAKFYKDTVCLMIQDDKGIIRKIVWNIHDQDEQKRWYNSYTRFITDGRWTAEEFIANIKGRKY